MRRIIIIAVLSGFAVLFACSEPIKPVSRTGSTNPQASVDLLFEKDGNKIWRFYDGGRAVYYVTPSGSVTEIHSESCGKGCVHDVETQTQTKASPSPSPKKTTVN